MALFDRSLLNDGVRPREVFAWSMYDFANSGYTTVVLTAVFNSYFVGVVAGGASWATLAWTAAVSVSALLVMFTTPAIGAWADAHAAKKKLLMLLLMMLMLLSSFVEFIFLCCMLFSMLFMLHGAEFFILHETA